ncbi:aldose epimerase family protein [Umboniibacter marinipuniceus]|uniref:Aldose 1-epimerase n=1 Tax=Umboniibacter marinipuniceus TaxID=569599 RepID=A0A3M0A5P5_9GAMM|nr:aldose epimerase family protein [Umboniibacter marinipuniceus]RMA78829.1 aldose 1-epimerase [Umboniibacter marinipuniceus]
MTEAIGNRSEASITPTGLMIGDQSIDRIELSNGVGSKLTLLSYGASIARLQIALSSGELRDTVLFCNSIRQHLSQQIYLGSTIGRYANRIHNGQFKLGDSTYQLSKNENNNTLHGGSLGFDKRVWQIKSVDRSSATLRLQSNDGDQGFPGRIIVYARFSLSEDNVVSIDYRATANAETPLNITAHPYFNLARQHPTISTHQLEIFADRYLPVDPDGIPAEQAMSVIGNGFDFREPRCIGDVLLQDSHQEITAGYDHSFIIQEDMSANSVPMARLSSPRGDLTLTLRSNMPAVQCYAGGGLAGTQLGNNQALENYAAVALEPQFAPDSPNRPDWPNCIFGPQRSYHHQIQYQFNET